MFCPDCGKDITEGQSFCQHCGGKISGPELTGETRGKTPWEDREAHGFFNGLTKTLKSSLFTPVQFFQKMPVKGGLTDPMLYALITGMVGVMISYAWQILLEDSFRGFMPAELGAVAGYNIFQSFGLAFLAILAPFMIIIALFIWAGVLHLLLMLVSGAKNGFEATFRAASYSYGAYIFMALPFCGGLIAFVWCIVLAIIGLREAHGTSGGKASFAVLFPLIVCCIGAVLIAVLIAGTMAASFGAMSHQWR